MVEIEEEGLPPHPAVVPAGNDRKNVVSNGETSASDNEDMFSATDEDIEDEPIGRNSCSSSAPNPELDTDGELSAISNWNNKDPNLLFYDENLDEEDEVYVYKHMRGGISENVAVSTISSKRPISEAAASGNHSSGTGGLPLKSTDETITEGRQEQQVQMLKPRQSDAVLSCPCCFNTVCMDCQKHKRYANQYRAMFVLGVVVDWNHILVFDETHRGLVSKIEQSAIIEEESREWHSRGESHGSNTILRAKDGEYYAVECAACRTQVAALDMNEVYHFHGCLESSSAF